MGARNMLAPSLAVSSVCFGFFGIINCPLPCSLLGFLADLRPDIVSIICLIGPDAICLRIFPVDFLDFFWNLTGSMWYRAFSSSRRLSTVSLR